MKDSGIEWIGEIPADWELGRIGQLYSERREKVSDTEYAPLSVTMQGIVPQLSTAAKTDAHDDRKLVKKGDFAINSRSDRRGSCGVSPFDGSVSLINTILCPHDDMNAGYYNWLFHTSMFADEYYKWGHGIVNDLWTTGWQEMKRISIPVPAIEEQAAISNYLDQQCAHIDAVIEKTKASIEEYKKLKQAVITQAVTKGIRGDRPMKDSGIEWIGEIPADWEVTKLKYICNTQGRIGFKGYTVQDQVDEGEGALSLGATHMVNGKISLNNPVYISWDKYYESPEIMVKKNDLLIVQRGSTIGKVAIVDKDYGEVTINPSLVLINKICINSFYLLYSLSTNYVKTCIEIIGSNTAIPMISQKQINDLVICMPKEKELNEILVYLDEKCVAIDELIEKKEKTVIEIENYKKSLIYEYVTGKKEVPQSCQ
ncbi:MAG: restriction endonuclease subunit S [Agathobacter sp.]